jgi:hypothetical protein
MDEPATAAGIAEPCPPPPAVALTAEQCAQLRFDLSLGLTAMLHSATLYGAAQTPERSARVTSEVVDVYRFVDAALTKALGAGLTSYERVGPAMDTVTIALALGDVAASSVAPPAALH